MMTAQFLAHIFKILKKWLSRLARSSASLFVSLLSLLLRRTRPLKLSDRPTYFSTGASQSDITGEDVFICSSLVPPSAGGPSSSSDEPYTTTQTVSLRKSTGVPSPEVDTTTKAAEPYRLSSDSVLIPHLSQQPGESSSRPETPRILYDQKGKGVDPEERAAKESSMDNRAPLRHLHSSPGQSPLSGLLGLPVPSVRSLSVHSGSGTSVYCSARSIAGSESRQAEYRLHTGSFHSRPVSVRGSLLDLQVSGIDSRFRLTAPPDSTEQLQPGPEAIVQYLGPPISEMVTDGIRRYKRCIPRPTDISITSVPAMTIAFPLHDEDVPAGWITFVHPEGSRYFVHTQNRTFTENNICDDETRDDVEYYMEYLLDQLKLEEKYEESQLDMSQIDLVIEPKTLEDNNVVCNYYFANHRDRCLFWLDEFNTKKFEESEECNVLSDCKGIKSLSHIRLAIQAQYWRHWDYFPNLCPVTQIHVKEVESMLVHAKIDHLTSSQSSAAYDVDELRDYLSIVKRIEAPPESKRMEQCHAAIVIGRIMNGFSHNAFVNFHGENCARLSFNQTVHGWKYTRSRWMGILDTLLFFGPATQVQELHKIFADKIARTSRWNAFNSKLKGQLQESNILATVLLNANVAFLGLTKGGRFFIEMASCMSLVTSLGSIVLGLFFVSQDRISGQSTVEEAGNFLSRLHDENHGLESLAVIFSLPKALLMWGMVFFFVAFSMYWCTSGDDHSRGIVGAVTLLVLVMIVLSIIHTKEGDHWWPTNLELWSHLANAWKRCVEVMRMKSPQREDGDEPETEPAGTGTHANPLQATTVADIPTRSPVHSTIHPDLNSSIRRTSTSSLYSHHQPNDGHSIQHSPRLRTKSSVLSHVSSLQHIPEDTRAESQGQPTAEAHREANYVPKHIHFAAPSTINEQLHPIDIRTKASPLEREGQIAAVATDPVVTTISPDPLSAEGRESVKRADNMVEELQESATPPAKIFAATFPSEHEGGQIAAGANESGGVTVSPDPLHAEEKESVKHAGDIVEDPQELEVPESPPPTIYARSATGDEFRHAKPPPRWTLQAGHDILLSQEEE